MASHISDLKDNVVIGPSLSPSGAKVSGSSPYQGAAVDLRGTVMNQCFAIIIAGTITDGTHVVSFESSQNDNTADEHAAADAYTAISGVSVSITAAGVQIARFASPERYVRAVSTVAATTTGGIYGVAIGAHKRLA